VAVATANDAMKAALRLLPCRRPDLCKLGIAERLIADPSRVKATGGKFSDPRPGEREADFHTVIPGTLRIPRRRLIASKPFFGYA
jgi:hypothetical protein